MDSDSFKPECQYFDIYLHDFWLAACLSINFQACHYIITNNGFQAFSVSLWFEFCSASVTVNGLLIWLTDKPNKDIQTFRQS